MVSLRVATKGHIAFIALEIFLTQVLCFDMFFHFMLEIEFCVTNITGEISFFLVNCLHMLFWIAFADKLSSTNLTDFKVLFFWMRIEYMLFETRFSSMCIRTLFTFKWFF